MTSKVYQVEELYDLCTGECGYCVEYYCTQHPQYNWLNPDQPLSK